MGGSMLSPIFIWPHLDEHGIVIGEIHRFISGGKKEDIPYYTKGESGFLKGIPYTFKSTNGYPLFGIHTLQKNCPIVIVVEGQKVQAAFDSLGFSCVTSILGAGNANSSNWGPLSGNQTIILNPDNDKAGEKYVESVADILNKLDHPPQLKIFRFLELNDKEDACDWLQRQPELVGWDGLQSLEKHPAKAIIFKRISEFIEINASALPRTSPDTLVIEKIPLQREITPPPDFPVEALGPVLGDAAKKMSEVIQAPIAICGQSILAATALAIQGHADIFIDGRKFPTSNFFLTIGESGERKSAVDNQALRPHREHQKKLKNDFDLQIKTYQNATEVYKKSKEDALKKEKGREAKTLAINSLGEPPKPPLEPIFITEEPTYEGLVKLLSNGQPSIGLFSDEGGRFIGGHGMNNDNLLKTAAGLSSLWDGKPITRVRAGDGNTLLYGRRLTFHLMLQPGVAQLMLANAVLEDQGILSRNLISFPQSTAGTRKYVSIDLSQAKEMKDYWATIQNILDTPYPLESGKSNELEPTILRLTDDAKKLWVNFHNRIESLLGKDGDLAPIKGFANKAPEHVARISGILTLADNIKSSVIDYNHMAAAINLVTYYINEAIRLFGTGANDPQIAVADALLKWLQKRSESIITLVEIYQYGPNSIRNAKTARKLMQILVEHGWVTRKIEGAFFKDRFCKEAWAVKP
jgi:hypothetical protein